MIFLYTNAGYINISAITRIDPRQKRDDNCHIVRYDEGGESHVTHCAPGALDYFECTTIPCPIGWYAVQVCHDDAEPGGFGWDSYPVLAWIISADMMRHPITHSVNVSQPEGYIIPDGRVIDSDGELCANIEALVSAYKRREEKRIEKAKRLAKEKSRKGKSRTPK